MLLEGRDEDEEKTIIDDGTDETYPGDVDEGKGYSSKH